jgi:serine/threonine protein kinase
VPGGQRGQPGSADEENPANGGGWTVPGYTHVREIGTGASGRVVLAVDDVTQTQVIIKYLRPGAAPPGRFRDEAAKLGALEDPNLVQFYEYAESPGNAAVVTEFNDGVSLRWLLVAEGGIGVEAALSVLSGLLLGLAALHDAEVAHRALKPENVLIAKDGTTKLADAGIGDAPAYLAPERRSGPAADLYAASMIFVECLTEMKAVPEPFRPLIEAGLWPDPAARPASAAAYLASLDDIATSAYGESWESIGRARLAVHAERAEAYVPSEGPPAPPEQPPAQPEHAATPQQAIPEQGTSEQGTSEQGIAQQPAAVPREPTSAQRPATKSSYGPWPPLDDDDVPAESGGLSGLGSRETRRSPTQLALAASIAVILAVGITWYVLHQGKSGADESANAQAASPPPAAAQTRPPQLPSTAPGLAESIRRAAASRHTASFTYRAPGVAAQGTLNFTAGEATEYDMRVTPLKGVRPDRSRPNARVILVRSNAYVGRAGWKSYSTASTAVSSPTDPGQRYATLAANTRWGSSLYNVLALLETSQGFRRTGLTYRGAADLVALSQDKTVAELYKRMPRGAVVAFTLDMAQNSLPRQLTVTITGQGLKRIFRTIYTGWGKNASIAAPR